MKRGSLRSAWRRTVAIGAALSLALTVVSTTVQHGVVSADSYAFWFVKNGADQTNSTLAWANVSWTQGGSWRAGSGQPGYDECHRSTDYPLDRGGWLPNGTWSITGSYSNYNGQVIKGPAIRLADRQCYNGNLRQEIFIHSAFPWASTQYLSQGCIKVSSRAQRRRPAATSRQCSMCVPSWQSTPSTSPGPRVLCQKWLALMGGSSYDRLVAGRGRPRASLTVSDEDRMVLVR